MPRKSGPENRPELLPTGTAVRTTPRRPRRHGGSGPQSRDDPMISDEGAFYKEMPKVELHAHLTGSISDQCLHEVWKRKPETVRKALGDPLIELPRQRGPLLSVRTFFPIFSKYIYNLVDDPASVRYTTLAVLASFAADNVVHLELRTTPRAVPASDPSGEAYVETVLQAIAEFEAASSATTKDPGAAPVVDKWNLDDGDGPPGWKRIAAAASRMRTFLILSVDRRFTAERAMQVAETAIKLRTRGVVGLDLCGDPSVATGGGPDGVAKFGPAFALAKEAGLGLTLHFGETVESSRDDELRTLLSWKPDRLGHVIHMSDEVRGEVLALGPAVGLEMCLTCNVNAGLLNEGSPNHYKDHHLGEWYDEDGGPVPVLCTDDVGIFQSHLSEEYRLAAQHHYMDSTHILPMAYGAIGVIFGGEAEKSRLREIMWQPKDEIADR